MKRKLSALLAIVLVVVMVFPTAVFVGADGTAIVVKCGSETVTSVDLAVGQKKTLTIDTTATIENVVIQDTAVANLSWTSGAKTFELEGRFSGQPTTTVTITYKDGENASQTYTVSVSCHEPKLLTDTVEVVSVGGVSLASGTILVDSGTKIESAVVTANRENSEEVLTASSVKFSLDGSSFANDVTLTNTESSPKLVTVHVQYTFDSINDAATKTGVTTFVAYVNQEAVKTLTISANTSKNTYPAGVPVSTFVRDNVVVTADGNIVGYDNIKDSYKVYNKSTNAAFTGTITKSNIGDLAIEVTYKGKTASATDLTGYVDFTSNEPDSITVDFTGATKKTYYDGDVLDNYDGIKVTIGYKESGAEPLVLNTASKIDAQVKKGNLTFSAFSVNSNKITVTYKEGEYSKGVDVAITGITVVTDEIKELKVDATKVKSKTWKEGDTLSLSGMTITLSYDSGATKTLGLSDVTCTPANGSKLSAGTQKVTVKYNIPGTNRYIEDSFEITVSASTTSTSSISSVVYNDNGKIKEYYVGEKLDASNYTLTVVFTDTSKSNRVITLDDCEWSATDTTLMSSKTFKKELSIGELEITYKLPQSIDSKQDSRKLTIKYITVVKRPTLSSITAATTNTTFLEGESPKVKDFYVVASYADTTKQFVFKVSDYDDYETYANKSTYTYKDGTGTGSVTYKMTLTPSTIESDTKSVRVTYSEQVYGSTTITKYYDVEIEVTVPDAVLTYYDTTEKSYVTESYIDFKDALEAADKVVRSSSSSYTSSYYNRVPEIQLRRDVTMTTDWPISKDLVIDLNGHNLTMIRGEVYVASSAGSDIEITFTNEAKTDAKLIYSTNDDDTIILGEDDTFTIDKSSRSDIGKYDVTISSVKNGKVEGPKEVTHGHDAKFTITPDENYKIKSISVKQDKTTKKYTETDGVVTVEDVQGDLTITVTFEEKAWDNPFTDVYKSATYYKSIQFVYENGLFSGMSATKFEPDTTMTRAMFVTVLGRLANVDTSKYTKAPDFTDVSTTDVSISYAIPYIQWAVENDLIQGYGNGKFGPKDNITHIQMYVLMQRYASYIEKKNTSATTTTIAANDVSDIPTWTGAYEAVQYAAKYDFLVTSSNRITPNGDAKRSELAMLLEKFCDKVLEWNK